MDSEIRDAIKALTAQAAIQAEQNQAIRLQLDESFKAEVRRRFDEQDSFFRTTWAIWRRPTAGGSTAWSNIPG